MSATLWQPREVESRQRHGAGAADFCSSKMRQEHKGCSLRSSRIASQRIDHEMNGATIVVRGETFPVHAVIVSVVSPVFKAALWLSVKFKEGKSKSIVLDASSKKQLM